MGILDSIRGKIDEADKAYNPLRKVADTLENAGKKAPAPTPQPSPPVEAKTPQQLQYEAKEKYMNRNNPGYVPRAKGGCVKKGGAPKNVDNSGLTKERIK